MKVTAGAMAKRVLTPAALAKAIASLAAVSLAVFGVVRGTWAVGGSDSSCYALMAEAFAHGSAQPLMPLAQVAPWDDAALTLAPAGFFPSPVRAAAASPICAPGFSLLLVPFRWLLGRDGIFFVTPVAAALLVWSAFVAARFLGGPVAGAMAAVVVAASPIVLFQAVQPMNDIATTALWTAVVAAATLDPPRRWWMMGTLTGLAVLVRPNLAPVAGVVALWVVVNAKATTPVLAFSLASLPFVVVTALFNWILYGHPLRLGYGSASDLFSASFVSTNIAHYGRALLETQTPFPLLGLAAPLLVSRERRSLAWLALGVAAATVVVYLPYRSFEEWWYLRFLLPAIAALTVVASATAVRLLRRPALVAIATVALALLGMRTATDRQAFDLQRLEARFRHSGEFVRDRLPPGAALLTVWQSGTVRFHASRDAVLWDAIRAGSLDSVVEWLEEQGREPFILVERWEEPAFRQRFGAQSALGNLDWPPRYEIDRLVRIYAPGDRAVYLSGGPVSTEQVLGRSRN